MCQQRKWASPACAQVKLVGWPRDGMERYIQWQNSQMTEEVLNHCEPVLINISSSLLMNRNR
jgi:hypothetical protein